MAKGTWIKPHPDNPIYKEGFRTYVPVSPKLLEASRQSKAGPRKDATSPSPASPQSPSSLPPGTSSRATRISKGAATRAQGATQHPRPSPKKDRKKSE